MLDVRSLDLNFYLVVAFVLLVVKIFAFVNSLMHSNEEYEAAGKLTKTAWSLILGLGVVVQLLLGGPIRRGLHPRVPRHLLRTRLDLLVPLAPGAGAQDVAHTESGDQGQLAHRAPPRGSCPPHSPPRTPAPAHPMR